MGVAVVIGAVWGILLMAFSVLLIVAQLPKAISFIVLSIISIIIFGFAFDNWFSILEWCFIYKLPYSLFPEKITWGLYVLAILTAYCVWVIITKEREAGH